VLERLLAGIGVDDGAIAEMGVGGLLMEIGSRPQPRETSERAEVFVEGLVLAAGQSRRMGKANKLTLDVEGSPIVRHVAVAADAMLDRVTVVTGHEAEEIETVLSGFDVNFTHNGEYDEGLSTSLKTGVSTISKDATHAMVLLGDMPRIGSVEIEKMLVALKSAPGGSIIVATSDGKRGNPVIWPRSYFEVLSAVSGDTGARHLIGENQEKVVEVELGEAAALDIDTPQAYAALGQSNKSAGKPE